MTEMNRREALSLGVAAVAAASMPSIPFAAPAKPLWPVWAVGSPGEFNWQMIRALTEAEAKIGWVEDHCGLSKCEEEEPVTDCDCEFCCELGQIEADRYPQLDEKADITPADWLRVGLGHICSRCSYETFREEGGQAVGDEVVCQDCMTLADWDIVDPERAAEMRAELDEEA